MTDESTDDTAETVEQEHETEHNEPREANEENETDEETEQRDDVAVTKGEETGPTDSRDDIATVETTGDIEPGSLGESDDDEDDEDEDVERDGSKARADGGEGDEAEEAADAAASAGAADDEGQDTSTHRSSLGGVQGDEATAGEKATHAAENPSTDAEGRRAEDTAEVDASLDSGDAGGDAGEGETSPTPKGGTGGTGGGPGGTLGGTMDIEDADFAWEDDEIFGVPEDSGFGEKRRGVVAVPHGDTVARFRVSDPEGDDELDEVIQSVVGFRRDNWRVVEILVDERDRPTEEQFHSWIPTVRSLLALRCIRWSGVDEFVDVDAMAEEFENMSDEERREMGLPTGDEADETTPMPGTRRGPGGDVPQ